MFIDKALVHHTKECHDHSEVRSSQGSPRAGDQCPNQATPQALGIAMERWHIICLALLYILSLAYIAGGYIEGKERLGLRRWHLIPGAIFSPLFFVYAILDGLLRNEHYPGR